ncbi:MAG: hypothetical protein ACLQUT_10410 [Thermoleophilia bacterium]
MAEPAATLMRTIVVPRELEEFFYDRLRMQFASRADVAIVVDRRRAERRRPSPYRVGPGPLAERRSCERRNDGPRWSLAEMPFSAS